MARWLMIFVLAIFSVTAVSSMALATDISGGIFENTTWTLANSPYHVVGDVTVFPGVTLTVEPGVEVRFDKDKRLNVRSTLIAAGTEGSRITFTAQTPPQQWRGITLDTSQGGHGTFSYCDVSYAVFGFEECCGSNGQPSAWDYCTFSYCENGLYGSIGTVEFISNSTFSNNKYGVRGGRKDFTDCVFTGNLYGTLQTEGVNATGCTFTGNTTGADGSRGILDHCTFTDNVTGVSGGYFEGYTMLYCCVRNNNTGIVLSSYFGSDIANIEWCDIFDNPTYNVHAGNVTRNVEMTNNWWGTTDTDLIDAGIYDGYDDANRGLISYVPFSTSPNVCGSGTPVQPSTWGSIKALHR